MFHTALEAAFLDTDGRPMQGPDGQIFVRAGAGIVADSDPESEFQETVNKARALIEAIDMAREGVD